MSSSQAVSRTEGPTSATWEAHKETIKNLYIKENMPLKDVIDIMRVNHGLVASVKMYKYRLKTWGLRKNNPIRRKTNDTIDSDSNLSCGSGPVTRATSPALPLLMSPADLGSTHAESSGVTETILKMLNRYFSNLDDPATIPWPTLSPDEYRQMIWQRRHSIMVMLQAHDPHSSMEMTVINFFMQRITVLAKQREYWSFVLGLHLLHRFSLTPGSGTIITMMLRQYRDALLIYLEPGHPLEQMWSQILDQVDQQQRLYGAPSPGVIPLGAIEVYTRCVDDHLCCYFGRLSYTYQESHLRMLVNISRPRDFAAEVASLTDDFGFPVSDMRFILESIFVEELMKECVHIELCRFSARTSPGGPPPTQGASFEDSQHDNDVDVGVARSDDGSLTDRDAIDVLVRLIGCVQTAFHSNERLSPEALRLIKLEAAGLIVSDYMGQDLLNNPSPYTM